MKKIFILSLCLFLSLVSMAQTPAVKKASQAMFSLTTFAPNGSIIATSYGVFVSPDGDAISSWHPFIGASRAVAVDGNGKKYDVDALVGANELYNVCKFRVNGKTPFVKVATAPAAENSVAWLGVYSVKQPQHHRVVVKTVEPFSTSDNQSKSYPFYIMQSSPVDGLLFNPIFSDAGEAVAMVLPTPFSSSDNNKINAVGASFPADFQIQHLGSSATTLASSLIPALLPEKYNDAQITLMLGTQQRKGASLLSMINQFVKQFPDRADGYQHRAQYELAQKQFDDAAKDMEKAIEVAEDKAEAHNSYSELILRKFTYYPNDSSSWTLANAYDEASEAVRLNDAPTYRQQQARVLFSQERYDEAYNAYMALQTTALAGPETMLAAAYSREAAGAPFEEVEQLMDSVIAVCPHPLTYQSGDYLLRKAQFYQRHDKQRKALNEYLSYEKLMVGHRLTVDFYHNRFLCALSSRVFQQALDDIQKCIELNPSEPIYYCEQGSLYLRLGKTAEAIDMANKAIIVDYKCADAYAILGVAQCIAGKRHEGIMNIEQAKSYGYEGADELLKKYKKKKPLPPPSPSGEGANKACNQ